jgi:hypothetical protein
LLVLVLAACSFEHGELPRDANVRTTDGSGPDAALIDAPSTCTDDLACAGPVVAMMCNGGCWAKCTNAFGVSVLGASIACGNWGGQLAPLRTPDDEACVNQFLFPQQASWIGLVQAPLQISPSAGWSWNGDGQAPSFTDWDSGQPNDGTGVETGSEQCAFMTTGGKWQDGDCSASSLARFSCRR